MDPNRVNTEQSLRDELNKTPEQVTGQAPVVPPTNVPSSQPNGQSSVTPTEPLLYTIPGHNDKDGNPLKFTGEQLAEEYKRLNTDYTQKSQELSQLKKSQPSQQSPSNQPANPTQNPPANPAVDPRTNMPALSAKDQALKSELSRLGVAFADQVPDEKQIIQKSSSIALSNVTLNQALDELEEDYDGSKETINGVELQKPKVDRSKVMEFIQDNPNTDRTPREIAKYLYADDFINYEAKRLVPLNPQTNLPATEGNGAGNNGEPPAPQPYNFRDGSTERGVREMLQSG